MEKGGESSIPDDALAPTRMGRMTQQQQEHNCDPNNNDRLVISDPQEVTQWRIFPVPPRPSVTAGKQNNVIDDGNDDVNADADHVATPLPQEQPQYHKKPPIRGRKWQTNSWHEYIEGDEVLIVDTKKMKKITRTCRLLAADDYDDDGCQHQQMSTLRGTVIRVDDLENNSIFLNSVGGGIDATSNIPSACRRLVYVKVHSIGMSSSSSTTIANPSICSDRNDGNDDPSHDGDVQNDIVLTFDPQQQQTCLQPDFSSMPVLTSPVETIVESVVVRTSSSNTSPRTATTVAVARETPAFRLLTHQLHSTDRVLEIGCSTGETSKRVVPIVESWVGFDTSDQMLDRCAEQVERVTVQSRCRVKLVKVDALVEPKRAFHEATAPPFGHPTVILLDIGGNREYRPVLQILSWVFEHFTSITTTPDPTSVDSSDVGTAPHTGSSSSLSSSFGSNSLRLIIIKSREIVHAIQNASWLDTTNTPSSSVKIDYRTGIVTNGPVWFNMACQQLQQQSTTSATTQASQLLSPHHPRFMFKHPLKAPLALSPVDEKTPICRYHNYHREGCKLMRPPSNSCCDDPTRGNDNDSNNIMGIAYCPSDHEHCHACREKGHMALNCTKKYSLY